MMPQNKTPRLSTEAREAFLAKLAATSNVTASAKQAGYSTSRFYSERDRYPAFFRQWKAALCEGYARLEAELLAEALRPVSGKMSDAALKTKQMRIRLGTTLLSLHRASVRGEQPDKAPPRRCKLDRSPAAARKRVAARLDTMHQRLKGDDDRAG